MEPLSRHEDSTRNAYLWVLLSQMVPSAVMEMLRTPGLGQWLEKHLQLKFFDHMICNDEVSESLAFGLYGESRPGGELMS
ncbi:hypothetical protein EYF80_033533 [Liparis tanakae]|uniref:Uncharacterized protein n=1 Tax=Liparis tanakae TaxID=230148 RepID=A0A4Z2GSM3_9TELE|nr:hypothetical protein EYF80_033533 [Liparis tanakae]